MLKDQSKVSADALYDLLDQHRTMVDVLIQFYKTIEARVRTEVEKYAFSFHSEENFREWCKDNITIARKEGTYTVVLTALVPSKVLFSFKDPTYPEIIME